MIHNGSAGSKTAAVFAISLLCATQPSARQAENQPYKDAKLSVAQRVDDLLKRMTLDEKIGQMTQADHASLKDPSEVDSLFLGSVLSGGDSELPDVSAKGWSAHAEALQKRALMTRLAIPIVYGIDAVRDIVARIVPMPLSIVTTSLDKDAPLWGSLLVATTEARERLRHDLSRVHAML